MTEQKLPEPIELTDAELDVVSGGSFVGIDQSNKARLHQSVGNTRIEQGYGSTANVTGNTNNAYAYISQTNYNTGSVTNSGSVS